MGITYVGEELLTGMDRVIDELENGGYVELTRLYRDEINTASLWGFDVFYLGDGRSGFVYMFESRDGKDRFAVKCVYMFSTEPVGYHNPLFDGEMLLALRDYPEIVDVYAYSETWVVMEYIGGDMLYDSITHCDGNVGDHVYEVRDGVANLLERVYNESKIFMFDVHDGNVLIDGRGGFRVIDAGMFREISKIDDEERDEMVSAWIDLVDRKIDGDY